MRTRTGIALLLIGAALAAGLLSVPAPPAGPERGFGWIDDPTAVQATQAALECDDFRGSEAYRAAYTGPDDLFLWDACRKVTGGLLPPRDQGPVGACVGFAAAAVVDHLLCVQIAGGSREEYRDAAPEVIYAGSRVEIGGGRVRGDGSTGAWAVRFVREYGVLPRGKYDRLDLSRYSPTLCRQLGGSGVPDELEPLAKKHPVKTAAPVRSWAELRAAVRNGYPVLVCSSQGFETRRDADGFCRPTGVWMHALAAVGVRGGPRPGAFLLNSWGPDAHRGPGGVGEPSPAGFWADAAVLDRMTRQGDSWAFSGFVGFPARKLDWYAMIGSPLPARRERGGG